MPLGQLAWALCVLALAACQGGPPAHDRAAEQAAWPVERRYERGPVVVSIRLSARQVTVADTISLRVMLDGPEGIRPQLPDATLFADSDLAVHQVHDASPALTGEETVRVARTFVIRPFLAGDYRIPSLELTWEDGGSRGTVVTEELSLQVLSVVGDQPPAFLDAGVPQRAPLRWWRSLSLGATASVVAAVGVWAFRRWRRDRAQTSEPELAPAEIALRALAELERSDLLLQGDLKTFHTVVSDIVRHYVEDRFGVRARERTTDEFLRGWQAAREAGIATGGRPQTEVLGRFLQQCDMVKFARAAPTQAISAALITIARRFVEADAGVA